MRKFLLAFTLISSFEIASEMSAAEAATQNRNDYQTQNFIQSLQSEISKQEALVNSLKKQIERTDIVPMSSIVDQFENAYTMLNVKKTLYANFVGTPSIQSPVIQAALLKIFKKDMISPGDLAELDNLVRQERPKYVPKPVQPSSPVNPVVPVQPVQTQQPAATTTVPQPVAPAKPNDFQIAPVGKPL